MTVPENVLTTHKRTIDGCSLFNIIPRDIARAWEPQHKLWEGKLIVEELTYLDGSSYSMVSRPSLYRFQFLSEKEVVGVDREEAGEGRLFCETQVINNLEELQTVLKRTEKWFQVAMLCEGQQRYQIALELRIQDTYQKQLFEDILLRIQDEYEFFDEMQY
ncbi:hypothetical protein KLMA_10411 [Kluyveromyces marxianus]|uniref:Uncharacterized protein n=2 Tax=Kluyveromyces marxianus TaxID=4911 RepID=W0T4Q5_KLUMD|nr:hypothetical protein KLMA_10411 [Kluyveromyces marxianus DMKU3-1042]QGN13786.1 hypothetical protein FIM1_432 [Kluyveromyces marxianus]BAO38033.1 hypothetical protein KLMA_10411 [Kluyveromyces marxianus DMKU3-1042]BAP69604.1 hypothetical protein KLMA_10411 [Kluyveromyces marxianus]